MSRPINVAGLAPRVLLARSMSESQLQGFVVNAARDMGWLAVHFRPGKMRSGKWATPLQGDQGGLDLHMVLRSIPSRDIHAELKGYDAHGRLGQLTPEQWEWLYWLQQGPGEAYLWEPADWDSGEILSTLKGAPCVRY